VQSLGSVQKDAAAEILGFIGSLDDKYTATSGRIYLSGVQALVRVMLVHKRRDATAGLRTAGFVSGYRGSPLGGLDETL
jgi:indolepyruvate ferredoxin oxidoreductase